MRRVLPAAAILGAAALLGTALHGPADAATSHALLTVNPEVTGFILDTSSTALLTREAPALSTASVAGISLKPNGKAVTAPDADDTKLADAAADLGIGSELLVSNFSSKTFEFDSAAAAKLLRNEDNIAAVADQIAGYVVEGDWGGVNVDLESLRRKDGPGLTQLVTELQASMPPAKTVSVDLMSASDPAGYRKIGYRLDDLDDVTDVLVLMSYDLHGPTWSGAGPIGPLRWQREVLDGLLEVVPPTRVDLGIAGYGYSWPKKGTGRSFTVKGARKAIKKGAAPPSGSRRRASTAASSITAR